MRKILFTALLVLAAMCIVMPVFAEDSEIKTANDESINSWAGGVSVLSPGLPIALKFIYQPDDWGVQFECNYFYTLGMFRVDGRRIVRGSRSGAYVYGFAGITASHFNDGLNNAGSINNTLMADLGAGGELRFGRNRQFSIGLEGGLLIPFYSNLGLDQYDDSGLMVANLYAVFWF